MRKLKSLWRRAFDVRPGEYGRTVFMGLYLLFVLFAYYILKPVSRALFLSRFDIDKLPYLYVLIAVAGGFLAYLYTKVAVSASLKVAVNWATALAVGCLAGFWWLIQLKHAWVLYAFNVWVSLFSVVLVSQGWLVASNIFDSRAAKRLYGLLGLGAVLGAAFGGSFTAFMVERIGPRNLLLASAALVLLAYAAFRLTAAQPGVSLAGAKASEERPEELRFRDIVSSIGRYRHLQVIIAIITLTFIVDVFVEFQFSYMAKAAFGDARQLTAFLGNFYGIYLNLLTFALQFFLTAVVVGRFGVGGALQVLPITMVAAAVATVAAPGLASTSAARLTEAASRYSFNRTGMELLYMPLPADLRNRTKAFVDICVDRMGRGVAGMLLTLLGAVGIAHPREISVLVIALSAIWILLSWRAQKEYVATLQQRLQRRRLDLESARVNVSDPGTLRLLEQVAAGPNARQACYALTLLADAPGYPLEPLLVKLAGSPSAEVRGKVYELAGGRRFPELLDRALAEVRAAAPGQDTTVRPAVVYLLAVSPEAAQLAQGFLEHPNWVVGEATLEALAGQGEAGREQITPEWIAGNAQDGDPQRRRLAALALGVAGDQGTEALHRLLADADAGVLAAACRAAGRLKNRLYLPTLVRLLPDARVRAASIEALASYGTRISGTLGDLLEDETVPVAVRRRIPRVLHRVADQRSVDVLLRSIGQPDLAVRAAVLQGLSRLREAAPQLDYGPASVTRQILEEARHYCELNAALEPLRDSAGRRTAAGLLARSIEERLRHTIERLFRLLGLRYPPKEIYAAYLAVYHRRPEQLSAAMDFLENTLDRELKRVLLPLLDAPAHLAERSHELFGIEVPNAAAAVRRLVASGDPWLAPCGMAAAAELGLRELAPEISRAAEGAGGEVAKVARSALAGLA